VEAPLPELGAGTFTQVTNSVASRTPVEGTTAFPPVVADDNRDATINDNGSLAAFTSTRDYTGQNSESANQDNPEIFSFLRSSATIKQVSVTPRGSAIQPIFNANPSLSGTGARLAFFSNTNIAPFANTATFDNGDGNGEVFYANIDATGAATGGKQVTNTVRVNPGDVANLYSPGRRISRDGNYIAFESFSSDPANRGGLVTGLGLYVFDATAPVNAYRQIGPRGDADAGASGGDIRRVPVFTVDDTDVANPRVVVAFASRQNIRQTDGTIPTTASEGQNPDENRPVQIYFAPLTPTGTGNVIPITRISKLPSFLGSLADTAPIASNTFRRIAFALARTEVGTGNFDLSPEAFYLLTPRGANSTVTGEQLSVTTGASALPVVVGSPSPTPTPSPSPTPTTPAIVTGVSPGMLINLNIAATSGIPVFTAQTATGVTTARSFAAPIQLGGVTVSINNAAAQLLSLNNRQIVLVVPPGLSIGKLPLVVNANGTIFRSTIDIVATRPDIFRSDGVAAPLGRSRIFNSTNRVLQPEPFTVTSIRLRGGGRRQTRVRLFLTGVQFVPAAVLSIRVGNQTISGASILTAATDTTQPGVQTIDFLLPAALNGAGDVPIVVTVTVGSNTFSSRLEDTAPRVRIL
jgi:uncharacterized protein (TIGR03437 family)